MNTSLEREAAPAHSQTHLPSTVRALPLPPKPHEMTALNNVWCGTRTIITTPQAIGLHTSKICKEIDEGPEVC